MLEIITSVDANLGAVYGLVAVAMFCNMSILVPPSEILGIGLGAAAFLGDLNIFIVIAIATIFEFLGTLTWYYAGIYNSKKPRTDYSKKHKFLQKIYKSSYDIEDVYKHHGKVLVFLIRFVPFVRALCSYPAGKIRMKFSDFAKYSLPGLALWLTIWCGLGYVVGQVAIKYHYYVSIAIAVTAYVVLKISFSRMGKKWLSKGGLALQPEEVTIEA